MRILVLFFGLSVSLNAAAYLDPGTGSMILQGLIAGIALGWLTLKNYWYKIAGFFGKKKQGSLLDDDQPVEKKEPGQQV